MEGILFLLFVLLLILLIVHFNARTKTKNEIQDIAQQISSLRADVTKNLQILIKNQFELYDVVSKGNVVQTKQIQPEEIKKEEIKKPAISVEEQELKTKVEEVLSTVEKPVDNEIIITKEEQKQAEPEKITAEKIQQTIQNETQKIKVESAQNVKTETIKASVKSTPPKPGFWERNPDLEKFIGENLLSKIGIVVLVIGLAFFVKFAIDKNWIGEVGRVGIGVLSGGLLLGIAHYLRKNFKAFSSVLVGGGIATLYFTIALAFQEYRLFSQTVAFVIMLVITIFAVLLSIAYNRQEIAILAILGGFSTPLMVSTGNGNYRVLFTYITLLNSGMLVLAYFRKWNAVNFVSYFATVLLFGAWLTDQIANKTHVPYAGALLFACIFYLLFFAMNLVNNFKEGAKFSGSEILVLLSNTFLFYTAGMFILKYFHPEFKGLFTIIIALFNMLFAYSLYKRTSIDKNLVLSLIGIVLTFISLTAPVQLAGNYITMFWAIEAIMLLWLGFVTNINLLKIAVPILLSVMFLSLLMDWQRYYFPLFGSTNSFSPILNKIFITGSVASISLIVGLLILRSQKTDYYLENIKIQSIKSIFTFFTILLVYLTLFFEIRHHSNEYFKGSDIANIITGTFNFLYVFALILWTKHYKIQFYQKASFILGYVLTFFYVSYYLIQIAESRNEYLLNQDVSLIAYQFHYLMLFLLIAILAINYRLSKQIFEKQPIYIRLGMWYTIIITVISFSAELDNTFMLSNFVAPTADALKDYDKYFYMYTQSEQILQSSHRIGFPILWGICAFLLMLFGMKTDNKDARIISITLIFVTLGKLFLYDFWYMSDAGKIAAFILLGIVLLVVSFLYNKIKRIILEGELESKTEDVK